MKESRYHVKSVSVDAVIACVLGVLSIACLFASILLSYHFEGRGPLVVGLLGIASLLSSVVGFIFSLNAWKSVDGKIIMKRVAILITTIPALLTIVLFLVGMIGVITM